MTQHTEKLAILFADINGSTALYNKLGDRMARAITARTIDIMMTQVTMHHGVLVKTIGDEIMCTFPSADLALQAACAMQFEVESQSPGDEVPIYIHIGFHYGDAIHENKDVFGDAVNIAAHVAHIARAREIMTTGPTVEELSADLRSKTRQMPARANMKGKQEGLEIFRVVWELDDTMTTLSNMGKSTLNGTAQHTLFLIHQDKSYPVNAEHMSIVMGRAEGNGIVVPSHRASRQHAKVEYRMGKFVLTDHSANGTFIRFENGHVIRLSHEATVLHGTGTISPGLSFDDAPTELIGFAVT